MSNDEVDHISVIPEVVYHYTSMDTMTKVIESKSLWCTAISYLNDASERDYVLSAIRIRLTQLQQEGKEIRPGLTLDVPYDDGRVVTSLAEEPFVTSFAARPDSLMHWRSYCPQQAGVAIGFRSACLRSARIAEKPMEGMVVPQLGMAKVNYVNTANANLDSVIAQAAQYAELAIEKSTAKNKRTNEYFLKAFRYGMEVIACTCKHSSFEVEDEYRLILFDVRYRENNIRFRTVRSTLIPHVAVHVPSSYEPNQTTGPWDAIAHVVVGPSANIDLSVRSVEALMAVNGLKVKVTASDVPYRDW